MTVCLAAICEAGKKIITVTDQMIGFSDGQNVSTVDGAVLKGDAIHSNWFALFASDDTTDVSPILDRVRLAMCSGGHQRTLSEAALMFQESYMHRHQQLIEFEVLKPLGFKGYDDFHKRAKDCLPESEHIRILQKIETIAPQSTFLVAGFDPAGLGHLFQQECKSAWLGLDELGWWAIGSGQMEAMSAMEWYAKNFGLSVPCTESLTVYCLLAAKFMAEASDLVGRETFVTSHSFNEPVRYLHDYFVDGIRAEWQKVGNAKISTRILEMIPHLMKSQQEFDELMKEAEERATKKSLGKKRRKRKSP